MELTSENEKQLFNLINKFSENIEYYKENPKSFPESECRLEYIDRFIKILGWVIENKEGVSPAKKKL